MTKYALTFTAATGEFYGVQTLHSEGFELLTTPLVFEDKESAQAAAYILNKSCKRKDGKPFYFVAAELDSHDLEYWFKPRKLSEIEGQEQ